MKRKLLKIIGLLILLFGVLSGLYIWKFNSETKSMSPVETGKIADTVYAVRDTFVNMYIVKDGKVLIAFDAGNDKKNIVKEFGKLQLDPNDVKAVFLTHTDADHTAALSLFKNAAVYISVPEEDLLTGKQKRFLFFRNSLDTPYSLLKDRIVVKIGSTEVKMILVPGHTTGSAAYVVNGKYLFTGDTLSLKNGHVALFNDFFNMDSAREAESISSLKKLTGIESIYTAHYDMSDNFKKVFENWKK
jgi:hydroxyacylglutathione hydrolase